MPDVITPHATVTVDGVAVPVASVSLTREISTDLPASVTGGGGMVASTGEIVWGVGKGGVRDPAFRAPNPGQRVVVKRGTDGAFGTLYTGFTGAVDETTGTASANNAASSIVDDTALLDRTISIPTHFAREVSGVGVEDVELSSAWLAYDIGRLCGMSAYHYNSGTAVVWASLAGSLIPSFSPTPGYVNNAGWEAVQTPTGIGITVDPGNSFEYGMSPIGSNGGKAVEWSIWADPAAAGDTRILLTGYDAVAGHRGFAVHLGGGRATVTRYSYNGTTTTDTTIIDVPASGWQPIGFHLWWGSTGWVPTLRVGSLITVAPIQSDTAATARSTGEKWQTFLSRSGTGSANLAGFVFDRLQSTAKPWAEFAHVARLTYQFPDSPSLLRWIVQPPQHGANGLSLLREVAAAELAGLWIDEDGVIQYRNRWSLRATPRSKTLTSTDNLIDLEWKNSLESLRSRVTVKWRMPTINVRTTWTVPVWTANDGGDTTLKQEDGTTSWVVEPDDSSDWLNPDFTLSLAAKGGRVNGSWWGGTVKTDSTNATVRTAATGDVTLTSTEIVDNKAVLTMAPTTGILSTQYLAIDGPVVKAQGLAKWTDMSTTVVSTLGPLATAPELLHDAGWKIQTINQATVLGNFLANLTAKPLIQIDRVAIKPDPTIRLGDVVAVVDPTMTGLTIEGVVFRIEESWADGTAAMSLGIRAMTVSEPFATLAEFDARWAGASLGTLDAAWSTKTLADLDFGPLL